jgi:2-succinyl-5-enolpyruvyl-6-hydroxy-3-cyclohexene-1-carboxylate synthase
MKPVQVNRNFIWAETFVNQIYKLGVKHVCISPGSRSTPLTLAFSKQKKIKSFVHIDERVSGFFALGLAKSTRLPIAIVTTSGTATAELYPAIVEAYMQRIPLIVCTADRPPELFNRGANQTINQWNLYRNHIRFFKNVGLPLLSVKSLNNLKKITAKAFKISAGINRGPVHLNFPFRKPLEPNSYTDEIDNDIFNCVYNSILAAENYDKEESVPRYLIKHADKLAEKITMMERGLIITGPSEFDRSTCSDIIRLSQISGYPVLADGLSQLRNYNSASAQNVYTNYDAFLRSKVFTNNYIPEIIIQFGRTVTSPTLQEYLANSGAQRFLINEFGDVFDPSGKSKSPIKSTAKNFCITLNKRLLENDFDRRNTGWKESFCISEKISTVIKNSVLENSKLNIEPKVIYDCISSLPQNTKVVIGNSMPVRDLDNFVSHHPKNLKIFFNRGASGIDGVTSTALGIAAGEKPVVLITGDLAFLHDLNALMPAVKYSIPLVVVLINNNGGGIFNMLPVSNYKNSFNQYFKTPHNLEVGTIVKSFGIKHILVKDKRNLRDKLSSSLQQKYLTVLEVKTDSRLSKKMRRNYWTRIAKQMDKEFTTG